MPASNNLDSILKELLCRFNRQDNDKYKDPKTNKNSKNDLPFNLSPSQALVLFGLLGGVLEVDSVLVDRDQAVEILLVGSLKQKGKSKKSDLECILDQIGDKPFDEVLKALINRLT